MTGLGVLISKHRNQVSALMPLFGMIAVVVVFSYLSPYFLTGRNLQNISTQMAILLICAVGEVFVVIMGCIDLSVPGVIQLSGVVSALLVPVVGSYAAIFIGTGVGALCGLINGLFYHFLRIPSLIVTLAMSSMATGLALIACKATPVIAYDPTFRYIAKSKLLNIPVIWIVAAAILILAIIFQRYTRTGRNVYAIGGRESVVQLFRIHVGKVKLFVFSLAGACYGFGGVLLAGRIGTGTATMGYGWDMDTIAAVVLGGTSVSGGIGGAHRALMGVFIMVVISNGLNLLGVSVYIQGAIKGIILIIAVALTMSRDKSVIVK
jgi:ribose/xylose/arabinose/galactoside ABC-type transport system permease subunit